MSLLSGPRIFDKLGFVVFVIEVAGMADLVGVLGAELHSMSGPLSTDGSFDHSLL